MSPMSMTVKAAREALDAAKRDGAFVNRYLDGDRAAFATMQRLMRAAYPDEAPGETRGAVDDSAFGLAMTAAPTGDGGGGAMPEWLREAGDAGFAPPKSPAHYNVEYAPHVEIDPEFDRMARGWMYKAELPAGWSSEIARDYQRRAAKPPSAAELAAERDAVLGRLRRHWGDETDAKLAQVRDLVHGIGDDRLIETLNRSGLGNNEWLIRQLAIFADRKAMKAKEREKAADEEVPKATSGIRSGDEAEVSYQDFAHGPGAATRRDDADSTAAMGSRAESFVQIADRSGSGAQLAEASAANSTGRNATQRPFSYPDIPLEASAGGVGEQSDAATKRPEVNDGAGRQKCILDDTPCIFKIEDNVKADGTKPVLRVNIERDPNKPPISSEKHEDHEVDRYEGIIEEEAKRQGVDPELVKAFMYVETTHGGAYGHIAEALGWSNSILPMNIGVDPWKGLGFSERDFNDPRMNIRAGVMLLKRIIERVQKPTVAKVATLWNNLRREAVSDFGARVAEVYRQKLWSVPKRRWHDVAPDHTLPDQVP